MRVFLGIALPSAIRSALAVQQFLLPLPRKVDLAQLHLTLVFLGEVNDRMLEAAHDGFSTLRMQPFDLTLSGLGLFGGARARAAWAGVAPSPLLGRLQAKAERVARVAGCQVETRRFAPHVTLGHFPPPAPEDAMRLERAVAMGGGFQAGPFAVSEMVLWQSTPSAAGPRHDELTRYPLD